MSTVIKFLQMLNMNLSSMAKKKHAVVKACPTHTYMKATLKMTEWKRHEIIYSSWNMVSMYSTS